MKMVTYQPCLLACIILSASAAVASPINGNEADNLFEMSLEDLMDVQITTISRVEEYKDDTPGNIYVYSREIIKARGYRSLKELLQTVPGFTVFHRDLQYVAGVRGLNANDNEKITLLINGQEFNGAQEPDFLNGPINLDNIERVEVVVGPSSFFQRANTLAATINLITRNINGTEVVLSAGNDLPYSATIMMGKQFEQDKRFNFSFTTEKKDGFDAWASDFRPNLAGGRDTGQLEDKSFFSILNGQYGDWTAQFTALRSVFPELLINNGSPLNDGTYTDEIYSLHLMNEHTVDQDLTTIFEIGAAYKKSRRMNNSGLPQPDTAAELSVARMEYDTELGLRFTGFDKHSIQAGVQGGFENHFDSYFTYNAVTDLPSFPQKTTMLDDETASVGIYFLDDYKVNEKLKLSNGIRVDNNTILGSSWFVGGRSAIIYKAKENWTTKFIYNRSVRFPTNYAANNKAWGRGKSGPSWTRHFPNAEKPEVLSTFEWQNIFYLKKTRLSITTYYQELNNFISWSEPHSNVGNFRGPGLEADIYAPVSDRFSLWANSAYNDSEMHTFNVPKNTGSGTEQHHAMINSDNRIVGSSKITANIGADWKLDRDITLTGALRYFTDQVAHDYTSSKDININNRYYIDTTLMWKNAFGKDMDMRLSILNILNNRKPVAGQWLGDTYKPRGTTLVASVYMRF